MTPQSLRSLIGDRLRVLCGLRLMGIGRGADMAMLDFRGPGLEVADHALHIQCSWRLEGPQGIITGRADLWEPADPDDPAWREDPRDYEKWRTLLDERLDEFHGKTEGDAEALYVQLVTVDDSGGFLVELAGGYRILVFPAGSRGECWRIFRPRSSEPHFVVPEEEGP